MPRPCPSVRLCLALNSPTGAAPRTWLWPRPGCPAPPGWSPAPPRRTRRPDAAGHAGSGPAGSDVPPAPRAPCTRSCSMGEVWEQLGRGGLGGKHVRSGHLRGRGHQGWAAMTRLDSSANHIPSCGASRARSPSPEQRGGAVHDEHSKARLCHHCCRLYEQLLLVLGVVRSRVGHVVQHILRVQPVPARTGEASSEGEGQRERLSISSREGEGHATPALVRACWGSVANIELAHRSAICTSRCGRKVPSVSM